MCHLILCANALNTFKIHPQTLITSWNSCFIWIALAKYVNKPYFMFWQQLSPISSKSSFALHVLFTWQRKRLQAWSSSSSRLACTHATVSSSSVTERWEWSGVGAFLKGWHFNGITSTGNLRAAEDSRNVDNNVNPLVAKQRAYPQE